jgi:hypothetical protein
VLSGFTARAANRLDEQRSEPVSNVATVSEALRAMDERDINMLAAIKRKLKVVADDFDVDTSVVLALLLTSLDNQTLRYAVEEIVT